jgi:hypothetical protein
VPAELRALIERCLQKDPGRRYQHASEVRAGLEAIQTGAVAPWVVWRYRLARRRYIRGSNAKAVLEEWRRRLVEGNECNLKRTEDADKTENLVFWSIHTHEGSGLEIRTKHLGVSLYHKPTA